MKALGQLPVIVATTEGPHCFTASMAFAEVQCSRIILNFGNFSCNINSVGKNFSSALRTVTSDPGVDGLSPWRLRRISCLSISWIIQSATETKNNWTLNLRGVPQRLERRHRSSRLQMKSLLLLLECVSCKILESPVTIIPAGYDFTPVMPAFFASMMVSGVISVCKYSDIRKSTPGASFSSRVL